MSKSKKPNEPFRRSQVVSPVPSGRRFGKAKFEKKSFDIYVSDIETGDETLAITVYAPTQREAIQIAKSGFSPRRFSARSHTQHSQPSKSMDDRGLAIATQSRVPSSVAAPVFFAKLGE